MPSSNDRGDISALIESVFREHFALAVAQPDKGLLDLGADSYVFPKIAQSLSNVLDKPIDDVLLFELPTYSQIRDHLIVEGIRRHLRREESLEDSVVSSEKKIP